MPTAISGNLVSFQVKIVTNNELQPKIGIKLSYYGMVFDTRDGCLRSTVPSIAGL